MVIIGERIKKIRQEKGLTQKDLGKLLGVSQQMIGQYESPKANLQQDTIQKIADALDVNYYDLFDNSKLKREVDVLITALDGMLAILEKKYGRVVEKEVQCIDGSCMPYYLIGSEQDKKFVLYEEDIEHLVEYAETFIPCLVELLKDDRPEQEIIDEIFNYAKSPENKKRIEQYENENGIPHTWNYKETVESYDPLSPARHSGLYQNHPDTED